MKYKSILVTQQVDPILCLLNFGIFWLWFLYYRLLPDGKKIEGYGTHRLGVELFKQDWTTLFKLLEEGRVQPIITGRFPILEAAKAYKRLESRQVIGNLVLLAPELI